MTFTDALLLGVLQGLTEFLPISSSGHLVLAQELLGIAQDGAALEVVVHLGTLMSVILWYRKDIVEIVRDVFRGGPTARLGWMVVVGSIPVALVGILLKDHIDAALESPLVAAYGLIGTGIFLLLTKYAKRGAGEPGFVYALIVGTAQSIAILPGVSRSGSTIGTSMLLGDDPIRAARFSFLLSIPAILGAAAKTMLDDGLGEADQFAPLVLAGAAAFLSGLAAIAFLLKLLEKGRLRAFGPYCLAAGALAWMLLA